MEGRLLICSSLNFAFTLLPLLASLGTLLCSQKNNTGPTPPFLARVQTFVARFGSFAGDVSQTALSLIVLVAVKREWNVETITSITRGVIFWEAALGVCPLRLNPISF